MAASECDLLQHLPRRLMETRPLIGGAWVDIAEWDEVRDPATGDLVSRVARCAPEHAKQAVGAAARAFDPWRKHPPADRGKVLRAWAALVRSNESELARLITLEQGKPLAESVGEVRYGASFLEWFAAEAERTYGTTIPSHLAGAQLLTRLEPLGVVVLVTPWNFPLAMITRKAGAALAAGCTVVIKPAPETPLTALALARLFSEASGAAGGVLNVVTGDGAVLGPTLLAQPEVRGVSFTGSTEVGRQILRSSADHLLRVSMELGGHAPFIVFDDADLVAAVAGCMAAKYATSGQDCLAVNRAFVHRPVYEAFAAKVTEASRRLRVGHGLCGGTEIGPMTKRAVVDKCLEHVEDALSKGAKVLTGGTELPMGPRFMAPTVLMDVGNDCAISSEETFGPVLALTPFDSENEVLEYANRTRYGLAAYVYTCRLSRAMRCAERLEHGMVAVNTPRFTGAPVPFGGVKHSGLGREGGSLGVREFSEVKYVCFGHLDEGTHLAD
jgi:succinate-semialdehyde dehydrogenase